MLRWLKSRFNKKAKTKVPDQNDDDRLPEYVIVQDVLDLHGFFPEQVPEMVREFVWHAEQKGFSEIRIIHGKGKSKLKWLVRRELENLEAVVDFCDAPPALGGWGATVVRIRTKKGEEKK